LTREKRSRPGTASWEPSRLGWEERLTIHETTTCWKPNTKNELLEG